MLIKNNYFNESYDNITKFDIVIKLYKLRSIFVAKPQNLNSLLMAFKFVKDR